MSFRFELEEQKIEKKIGVAAFALVKSHISSMCFCWPKFPGLCGWYTAAVATGPVAQPALLPGPLKILCVDESLRYFA